MLYSLPQLWPLNSSSHFYGCKKKIVNRKMSKRKKKCSQKTEELKSPSTFLPSEFRGRFSKMPFVRAAEKKTHTPPTTRQSSLGKKEKKTHTQHFRAHRFSTLLLCILTIWTRTMCYVLFRFFFQPPISMGNKWNYFTLRQPKQIWWLRKYTIKS